MLSPENQKIRKKIKKEVNSNITNTNRNTNLQKQLLNDVSILQLSKQISKVTERDTHVPSIFKKLKNQIQKDIQQHHTQLACSNPENISIIQNTYAMEKQQQRNLQKYQVFSAPKYRDKPNSKAQQATSKSPYKIKTQNNFCKNIVPTLQLRKKNIEYKKHPIFDKQRNYSPPRFLKNNSKITHNENSKQTKFTDFMIIEQQETERNGRLVKAIHKETGMIVCLKKIKNDKIMEQGAIQKLIKCIKRNMLMNHPNLRKLFGIFKTNCNQIYLIFQFTQEITLSEYIVEFHHLSEMQSARKIRQIGSSLKYIHERSLIHKGISSSSIFITYGVCKVHYFDLSIVQKIQNEQRFVNRKEKQELKIISFSYDVWRLGTIAYEMMTGLCLENGHYNDFGRKYAKIKKELTQNQQVFPGTLSKSAKQFLFSLLQPITKNRITIDQMLNCPFLIINKQKNIQWETFDLKTKNSKKTPKFVLEKKIIQQQPANLQQNCC